MKKLTSVILSAVYMLSTLLSVTALAPVVVRAHDSEDHNKTAATATADKKEVVYRYVAQPGDSYSKIARKAVQTYSIKNKIKLSNARVIAAETWLTQDAHSPHLNTGQSVSVKEATIKSFVDKAVKLSAAKEALWNAYTVGVNFNTNAVGQQTK